MQKTASQIADQVLSKVAVSPALAERVYGPGMQRRVLAIAQKYGLPSAPGALDRALMSHPEALRESMGLGRKYLRTSLRSQGITREQMPEMLEEMRAYLPQG